MDNDGTSCNKNGFDELPIFDLKDVSCLDGWEWQSDFDWRVNSLEVNENVTESSGNFASDKNSIPKEKFSLSSEEATVIKSKITHNSALSQEKSNKKISKDRSSLQPNARKTSGEKKFKCQYCVRFYNNRVSLHNHVLGVHKKPKYCCSSCDFLFHRRFNCKRHIETQHLPNGIEASIITLAQQK